MYKAMCSAKASCEAVSLVAVEMLDVWQLWAEIADYFIMCFVYITMSQVLNFH